MEGKAAVTIDSGTGTLEIVKCDESHRFVVLPKRWIVERSLAWISRNRRLARDSNATREPSLPSRVSP